MSLYIGIDLGTSGCRAIAIDQQGEIQGNAVTDLPEPTRNNHCVEQDPAIWWEAVCRVLSTLTASINSQDVKAIAVDGTSASLLLTDKSGTPLHSALMYNDARANEQSKIIAEVAPANTAAQGATSALAKLLWLYNNMETTQVCYAMHQADWITGKLSHCFGISDFNNVMKLGYDIENQTWPDWMKALLKRFTVSTEVLPNVVKPGTPVGTLTPELAKQFNLPSDTIITAGTTDSTASFLATGANEEGDAVTALGSTLVLKVISSKPVYSSRHGVYSQPLIINNEYRWLVGGASNSGGAILRHHFSQKELDDMTAKLKPETTTGLDYYPLVTDGERFPVNDDQMKPKLEPRPDNDVLFFQGILEGIARIEAKGYQLLAELGAPYPESIRTTGGGSKNPAWAIIRRNTFQHHSQNIKIIDAKQTEAAYGAALIAKGQ